MRVAAKGRGKNRRTAWVLAAALLATVATACGDGELTAPFGDPADTLSARCGDIEFTELPPDIDDFPPLDADAQAALDELVDGPTGVEAQGYDTDYRWAIGSRSDDKLYLIGEPLAGPVDGYADARFERRDGAWSPRGWGGCQVEFRADGYRAAEVAFDPDRPIDPDDETIPILIQERACASGRAPVDRDIVPVVTETEDAVTLIVLVEEVRGEAECPGNPWHPITVDLTAPLGSRTLFDGHQPPSQPVGRSGVASDS